MAVTERLMKAGQWDVALDPDTPKAIRDLVDFFGHVFIFDSPMRPGLSDATMIATSRWGGVVRRRQTPWAVSGANMISWLGDEDGKGPILEAALVHPNSFAGYIGAALAVCPAVTSGTITALGGSPDVTYNHVTPRAVMDHLCQIFTAEYRVNKNGTLDAGLMSDLFVVTPKAIAMRRNSGRDLSVTGIPVTQLDVAIDAEEYITRSLVQDTTSAWTAAAGTATPYKDLFGNLVKMTRATISSLTPAASAAALAASLVSAGEVLRQAVTLSTDEYDIDRDVMAGDWIWVYDQDSNMVDTSNQVRYRGSTIYPIKLRVLASTWPIERGMSVWYRDKAGIWTDLTNFIVWESPGVSFEVGASTRALLTTPTG